MDSACFITDPFAVKNDDTKDKMKDIGLTVEEYNEKMFLICERCGPYICEQMENAFKEHNVIIVEGEKDCIVGKDIRFKCVIGIDRNPSSEGLTRLTIITEPI